MSLKEWRNHSNPPVLLTLDGNYIVGDTAVDAVVNTTQTLKVTIGSKGFPCIIKELEYYDGAGELKFLPMQVILTSIDRRRKSMILGRYYDLRVVSGYDQYIKLFAGLDKQKLATIDLTYAEQPVEKAVGVFLTTEA